MIVTNELIQQWEPKVHRMLQKYYVYNYDYEDLAQELRVCIIRAAKYYNDEHPSKASFHTFLHRVMITEITKIRGKQSRKIKDDVSIDDISEEPSSDIELFDPNIFNFLTAGEAILYDLLLCGYNIKDIRKISVSKNETNKVIKKLRQKVLAYQ